MAENENEKLYTFWLITLSLALQTHSLNLSFYFFILDRIVQMCNMPSHRVLTKYENNVTVFSSFPQQCNEYMNTNVLCMIYISLKRNVCVVQMKTVELTFFIKPQIQSSLFTKSVFIQYAMLDSPLFLCCCCGVYDFCIQWL